jgi:hypothetical protein
MPRPPCPQLRSDKIAYPYNRWNGSGAPFLDHYPFLYLQCDEGGRRRPGLLPSACELNSNPDIGRSMPCHVGGPGVHEEGNRT